VLRQLDESETALALEEEGLRQMHVGILAEQRK
jgi:hypothetical protein